MEISISLNTSLAAKWSPKPCLARLALFPWEKRPLSLFKCDVTSPQKKLYLFRTSHHSPFDSLKLPPWAGADFLPWAITSHVFLSAVMINVCLTDQRELMLFRSACDGRGGCHVTLMRKFRQSTTWAQWQELVSTSCVLCGDLHCLLPYHCICSSWGKRQHPYLLRAKVALCFNAPFLYILELS